MASPKTRGALWSVVRACYCALAAALLLPAQDDLRDVVNLTNGQVVRGRVYERFDPTELVVLQGKLQQDRFSGGLRLNVNQFWNLAAARARFGRWLSVDINGGVPPVADVVRTWPAKRVATDHGDLSQGLGVRLRLVRPQATAELDLGDDGRFWPSDEALARWRTLAEGGRASVVYD